VAPVLPESGALAPVVRAAFGPGSRVIGVQRLRGGTKKGVYRLVLDDERTVACYIWSEQENYWPAATPRARTAQPRWNAAAAPARRDPNPPGFHATRPSPGDEDSWL